MMRNEKSSHHSSFFISLLLASLIIYADINFTFFSQIRGTLSIVVTPFRFVANLPESTYSTTRDYMRSRSDVLEEIERLKTKIKKDEARFKSFDFYKNQNKELKNLLQIPAPSNGDWIAASVERNISQPLVSKLYLKKGILNDILPGQVVVDELGVLGQIVRVDADTSVVNFIIDINQWVSARVHRNNHLVILKGNGYDKMLIEYASNNADLQIGDELIIEGGDFPNGYPIGRISLIEQGSIFIYAEVTPYSKFQNNTAVMIYKPKEESESNNSDVK